MFYVIFVEKVLTQYVEYFVILRDIQTTPPHSNCFQTSFSGATVPVIPVHNIYPSNEVVCPYEQ
jgi:hypothetical protein